jgi:hypothetical protein
VDKAWSLVDGIIVHHGRIFLPPSLALWPVVVEQAHGMGHEGVLKTLHRLRATFFTSHCNKLVRDFVAGCATCQRNKIEHLHPKGLLQPLTVSDTVWSNISMDFVEGFPKVGDKSTVLRHPYMAVLVAKAFFDHIIRLHGLHASIISDRDLVFTS